MNRILVTGATGTVGGAVLEQLRAAGAAVRAMARRPETAALPGDVEVKRGDLTLPETLDGCLEGIDTVFLVWIAPGSAVAPALEKILPKVRRVVYLSAPLKTPHPMFQQPNALRTVAEQIERTIEGSGVEWTFVRSGMFAANCKVWWGPAIRKGDVVRWPYASVPTAPIHEHDIAAVAVRALTEAAHAGKEYVITGPQSLTQAEQAATIGRAIGRGVRMEEISPEEARQELTAVIPAPAIPMLLNAWGAAAGQPAWVTETVGEITGRPARTFFDWAVENAAIFRD